MKLRSARGGSVLAARVLAANVLAAGFLAAGALLLVGCGGTGPKQPDPDGSELPEIPPVEFAKPAPIDWQGTGTKGQFLQNRMWVLAPTAGVQLRPRHTAHARMVMPVGASDGPGSLAELTALVAVHAGDPATGRPPLMQQVRAAGGTLEVVVEDHCTTFRLMAPTKEAAGLLDQLILAIGFLPTDRVGLESAREAARETLVQRLRADDHRLESRWLMAGGAPRTAGAHMELLVRPDPSEVVAFHQTRYRPDGCALAVWFPGAPVDAALARAGQAAGRWPAAPRTTASELVRPPEECNVWFTDDGSRCKLSVLIPLPDPANESWAPRTVMLDAAMPGPLGGRLEQEVQAAGLSDLLPLEVARRHLGTRQVLELGATGTPQQMEALGATVLRCLSGLKTTEPRLEELDLAFRRARLDLARLDSTPEAWSTLALTRVWNAKVGDPLRQHRRVLSAPEELDVRGVAAKVAETPVRMVFSGGAPSGASPYAIQTLDRSPVDAPELQLAAQPKAQMVAAGPLVARVCKALGGSEVLAQLPGLQWQATTTAADAPSVVETMRSAGDGAMWWQRFVLGSAVLTRIEGTRGELLVGDSKRPMSGDEVRRALMALRRHPIMVMGRLARGDARARLVAQRVEDSVEMAILAVDDPAFDRLLLQVDPVSGLIRFVESWQEVPGEATIYRREMWSDYRTVGQIRVPHLLQSRFQQGGAPARTVYEDVQVRAASPAELVAPPAPAK